MLPENKMDRFLRIRSSNEPTTSQSSGYNSNDKKSFTSNNLYSPEEKNSSIEIKEIKNNHIGDDNLKKCSPKLIIRRIEKTNNYMAISSQSSKLWKEIKSLNSSEPTTPKKSLRKSSRYSECSGNNVKEELINKSIDEDMIIQTPKKNSQRISKLSSSSKESIDLSESNNSKHTKKCASNFYLNQVDLNNILSEKRPRRSEISSTSNNSNDIVLDESNNIITTLPYISQKRSRNMLLLSSSSNAKIDIIGSSNENRICRTPKKRSRNNFESSDESSDSDNTLESNNLKHLSNTSTSPSKNTDTSLGVTTPKRIRKPVARFGVGVDLDKSEFINTTPKSVKKGRKKSIEIISKDQDIDFEKDIWKTPVDKCLEQCLTPKTHSGSRVRRSILQDIPENEEINVMVTLKTPRKTPKAHVKNLTASASKRLDSGAKIPSSPLEIARASLHLHAAPKHLPCREVEFKSIHSFLARKINDELTGSMYISGVPGTGKTATVKRVIDKLNADIIMKNSFKFIEINGLRLANPHQAFSVIWKELTSETVSSSKAQVLLNNYFSGKKVREFSTILLVDEVDHICNRKQDVVYNILDWPSRIGSKVIVITIANTMDLPERVLRGCVTSRMGLTRLVFKPYTFQQLQEIIMNRLIGNSLFDPDAVQLVARKVAAVSGDARRALDICRRAIDLMKSDDESQLITINHVNQVLNSILSGVRVTAIKNCSLFEQYFLRALRDETTRTGFDHSTIDSVYIQMKSICLLEGEELPNDEQVIMMAYRLRDHGLIFLEKKRWDVFRKVSLNVSPEDISYALDKYNN